MSIEEKRRADFEAAMKAKYPDSSVSFERDESGQYPMQVHYAWTGFNVALDSLVIELPHYLDHKYEDSYGRIDDRQLRDDTIAAIEAAGLKVKS